MRGGNQQTKYFIYYILCLSLTGTNAWTTARINTQSSLTVRRLSEDDADILQNISYDREAGSSSKFGEFVPLNRPADQIKTQQGEVILSTDNDDSSEILERNKLRNIVIAISSFAFAIINFVWQYTHPLTAVSILASMETNSAPLTSIGNNGKPTVIDFWAPWCSNCKVAAPTLQAIEKEYGDSVNFIMVNGDDGKNWALIQLFGVDAIPHLALLSDEGDVETALIGPMSRNVLRADLDALLTKRENCGETIPVCHDELPYKMYDAFGNRESRRINFQRAMEEIERR